MSERMRYFMLYQMNDLNFDSLEGGPVHFLWASNERRPSIFDSVNLPKEIVARLIEFKFNPGVDVFVAAGHFASLTIAIHAITQQWGRFHVALYHAHIKRYIIKELDYARDRSTDNGTRSTATQRDVRTATGT